MVTVMKKIRIAGIIIIIALFIMACSKGSGSKESTEDSAESFKRSYYNQDIGMVSEDSCFCRCTGDILMYYNNQTGKSNIFCFDPTCTHPAPVMGNMSSCFARSHQVTDFPMLSGKHLYFFQKEGLMKSKLIQADKDTKNQKVFAEFEGNATRVLCCDDTIITIIEDEYQWNSDGEFERKEKMKITAYATNVADGKTKKLFEDEQYNCAIVDSCFSDGRFNYIYYVLDMSEDELNEMYEKYGMGGSEEEREYLNSKSATEIISVDVKEGKVISRKKVPNNNAGTAGSEKAFAFMYENEGNGKTLIYDIENDKEIEADVFGVEIFGCGDSFLVRSGKCDLVLIDAGSGEVLKRHSYEDFYIIRTVVGKTVYYMSANDESDNEIFVIGLDDFMDGKIDKAVKAN